MEIKTATISEFPQLIKLIPYLEGHNGFIAGGVFKNIFLNTEIKDIDIFFKSYHDYEEAAQFFISESSKYKILYNNENATAFTEISTGLQIELIKYVFDTPISVISNFDFSVCKFALSKQMASYTSVFSDKNLKTVFRCVYVEKFFEDLTTKKLVLRDEIRLPALTMHRVLRYVKYGFSISKEEYNKLIVSIISAGIDGLSDNLNSDENYGKN